MTGSKPFFAVRLPMLLGLFFTADFDRRVRQLGDI